MRTVRAAASIGTAFLIMAVLGCGGTDEQHSMARRVNASNKVFKGTWVYKARMGEQHEHPVLARMDISVDGKRFRLKADWTSASPAGRLGTEEWVSDGKHLWQMLPSRKQVNRFGPDALKALHFWRMPHRMSPFGPARDAGLDGVAGRKCRVLATTGKYDQGDVTLKYWVDSESDVLLKKEHVLGAGGLLLVHETFECEQIQYGPQFSQRDFVAEVPEDWVEVEKLSLDSELLNTKF